MAEPTKPPPSTMTSNRRISLLNPSSLERGECHRWVREAIATSRSAEGIWRPSPTKLRRCILRFCCPQGPGRVRLAANTAVGDEDEITARPGAPDCDLGSFLDLAARRCWRGEDLSLGQ